MFGEPGHAPGTQRHSAQESSSDPTHLCVRSGVTNLQTTLPALYAERLRLLISKSPLSHGAIAVVLEDMLESDMVMLWELMGNPVQSEPFEELLGEFMTSAQQLSDQDSSAREAIRRAIAEQLMRVEGRLHMH